MTYQEKVEWLKSYRTIDAKVGKLTEDLNLWNDRATKITSSLSMEPKGAGDSDQLQKCVDKICELQEEIAQEMQRLRERRQQIETAIHALEDDRCRNVLILKYIQNCNFEEVAERMHYSWRQVARIHKKAVEKIKMS